MVTNLQNAGIIKLRIVFSYGRCIDKKKLLFWGVFQIQWTEYDKEKMLLAACRNEKCLAHTNHAAAAVKMASMVCRSAI